MITYFAFLFGLCCGILVGLGIWLSVIVSDGFKYFNHEIPDNNTLNHEHSVLSDR